MALFSVQWVFEQGFMRITLSQVEFSPQNCIVLKANFFKQLVSLPTISDDACCYFMNEEEKKHLCYSGGFMPMRLFLSL